MFNLFKIIIPIKKSDHSVAFFYWNYVGLHYICKKNILKRYSAILLVLVLSLRPMYYLAQVAYYELNIDYIRETYCVNIDKPELQCNGKCHLAKQLQLDDNSNSEDDASNGTAVILECFYPIFHSIQNYTLTTPCRWGTDTNISNHYSNTYAYLRDMSLLKPPKSKF